MHAWIRKTFVMLLLSAVALEAAPVEAKISSAFLTRGEKTLLEMRFDGVEPDQMPRFGEVKDVVIEPIGYGPPRMMPGRRLQYRFQYIVSSYAIGQHTIPAVEVEVGGVRYKTAPIELEVFDPNDLEWSEAISKPEAAAETVRYASIIKIPKKKIYENQAVESEIKIYVPLDLARAVVDWGVPEFEREGLAVWRYEANEGRGEVNLLGKSYIAISYGSTMAALRSGAVTIGPASVRLTYMKMIFDRFTQRLEMQANLQIPAYEFEVSPLPKGAPEGFDNAVGEFTIGSAIKQTEVTEGDPLALDIIVTGKGNLDKLSSPQMLEPQGWRIYDATVNQRGDERRELSGTVIFSQFIRPLEMKSAVPPFRLVYFDPEAEEYKTVMTEAIPITMTPASGGSMVEASGAPQALPLPIERMTDILGLVNASNLLSEPNRGFPFDLLQIVFALIAFLLIVKALWMRYGHLLEHDEKKARMKKDFQEVQQAQSRGGMDFLRKVGSFVEKWLGKDADEDAELKQIIEERDQLCFRESKQDAELPSERRKQILRILRRAAFSLILFTFAIPQSVEAQDVSSSALEAYQAAKYEEAAKLWLDAGSFEQLSADTLYNIGNAAYRMGVPGEAALYYRRALARDGSHAEARQNLRFIERKYGSITVDRPTYQYALARVPFDVWQGGLWGGGWLLVISLLIFPATRYGSRWRVWGVVGLVLSPIILSLGFLGCYYYPNDAQFAPLERQVVIVGDKVVLHTDAARTSPEVIDAPPGSLAEIIYESDRWVYIGFATQTRGWVPVESVEKIIPDKKPEAPKVRKSAADGSSA